MRSAASAYRRRPLPHRGFRGLQRSPSARRRCRLTNLLWRSRCRLLGWWSRYGCSDVNRRLAHFADGFQRIASAGARHNPFALVLKNIEQHLFVCRLRQPIGDLLAVSLVFYRLAGLWVELPPCPTPDGAVEVNVRDVKSG